MKIIVESGAIITKVSKKGNPYFQQLVTVYIEGKKYPQEVPLFINKDDPYPKGEYQINLDESLRLTDFGMEMGSVVLKPVTAVSTKAA